jgi:hypothetical protein
MIIGTESRTEMRYHKGNDERWYVHVMTAFCCLPMVLTQQSKASPSSPELEDINPSSHFSAMP